MTSRRKDAKKLDANYTPQSYAYGKSVRKSGRMETYLRIGRYCAEFADATVIKHEKKQNQKMEQCGADAQIVERPVGSIEEPNAYSKKLSNLLNARS